MVEFDFGEMIEHHSENIIWYGIFFAAGFAFGFVTYYIFQQYQIWPSIYNAIWFAVGGILFTFLTMEASRHRKR